MCDNKILDLVKVAAKKENFTEYELEIHGNTGPGDGYMSKIVFITVSGKTKKQESKTLNLVIKSSTENKSLRNQIPIELIFGKEIFIYDVVIPTFKTFQQEMGFRSEILETLPACYATRRSENEIVILEDLRSKGFDLWDRKIPMSMDYVRKILETYAEWHAFSLAVRWENSGNFEQLVKDHFNMWSYHIRKAEIEPVFFQWHEEVREFWENEDEEVASVKFSKDEISYILHEMIAEDPEYHVILHSDGWTNNFLFKVENNSKKPSEASIIDWQFSGLSSPILDLSYFIYTCVDTEEHSDVKELLKIYHDALSRTLYGLKSDPLEVLPFTKLVQQWKKFSCYGLLFGTFILRFSLCESDDVPDFVEGAENGKKFVDSFDFKILSKDVYYKRLKDNILHYVRNLKA